MPNPPTCTCRPISSREVCANCGGAGKPWLAAADEVLAGQAVGTAIPGPRPDPRAADRPGVRPLIGRGRWEAWAELMNAHGNAFAVGATSPGAVVVLAWDFVSRQLNRAEVANLVAWLLMVSGITGAELNAVCQAQGISLWTALELEAPAAVCGECGGELASKCVACGKAFP
jgi:hypothetical protein